MRFVFTFRFAAVAAMFVLFIAAAALACSPWFPGQLLPGDNAVLAAPYADFYHEIDRVQPHEKPQFAAVPTPKETTVWSQSAAADVKDLGVALTAMGTDQARHDSIVHEYTAARALIETFEWRSANVAQKGLIDENSNKPPVLPAIKVPDGLPAEFADYFAGVIAYHGGKIDAARAAWTALLARPAEQRKLRTVWATFMLGKSFLQDDPKRAVDYFRQTRKLAGQGFADSLGLASSSLGWEARAELNQQHYTRAIDLYLEQAASGDPTATMSLRDTVRIVFDQGPEALATLAAHPAARGVVNAFLLTGGGGIFGRWDDNKDKPLEKVWLAEMEKQAATNVAQADRLAWAAYQSGDMDTAGRWVKRAPDDAPMAHWIHAKLLLRDGDLKSAAAELSKTIKGFPTNEEWANATSSAADERFDTGWVFHPKERAQGELGIVQLSRGQYAQAMLNLVQANSHDDAAYIAESVLTEDELLAVVDQQFTGTDKDSVWIRDLLARRLVRLGNWKQARAYFPSDLQPKLDQYITAIREGHDRERSDGDRAASLFAAATIAYDNGMELMGTELEPDNRDIGGSSGVQNDGEIKTVTRREATVVPASDDEAQRATDHQEPIRHRYHYRYIAAEHAWAAALLMPDDTDETAHVLYTAGCWLKNRDPKGADRFYKALVNRCGHTFLGKSADALHWFPKTESPGATAKTE